MGLEGGKPRKVKLERRKPKKSRVRAEENEEKRGWSGRKPRKQG